VAAGRLRWRFEACALAVFLAFLVFYGALSAQYLLWPVPAALLMGERLSAPFALAATVALVGFYAALAPGVLWPADVEWLAPATARALWVAGTTATWLACAVWLGLLVRRGRRTA
jgi:hypothetical protein